jgi:ABC-2 type transport system permease protein
VSALAAAGRLVVHDARLFARSAASFLGERSPLSMALIVVAACVVAHALALAAALKFPLGAAELAVAARASTLFILPWTIASAMTSTSRALNQRSDLDLLFASPLDKRAIVFARLLGQAIESVASIGLILLPYANANIALGRVSWLAIYPTLAASGFLGASLGFALALMLNFAFGPRRARVVSQILASLVGASAVLVAQALAVIPDDLREQLYELFAHRAGQGAFAALVEIPERAALGDFFALLAWLGAALAIFSAAALFGGELFAKAALAAAGAPNANARADTPPKFSARLSVAMRIKEHRLLWRDPWLISQIMLQGLYMLPIGIVLWRQGGVVGAPGVALGPMLVVISGQLAGSLAWLALSAEDAPDFLATAPATRGELERAKLTAILMPVALFMAAPLMALSFIAPFGGFAATLGAAGAAASGALLMLWRQSPARRGMVLRRHSQSKLIALGEHWLSLLWAATTAIAAIGSFTFVAPLGLVGLTLWLIRPARPRPPAIASTPVTVLN